MNQIRAEFIHMNVNRAVFSKAIPQSTQTQCGALNVSVPTAAGDSFVVSSPCTVNLGTFLGIPVRTTWTATASVQVGQVGN